MATENGHDEKGKVLLTIPIKLRAKFKQWCHHNDISMNSGFCALAETVTSKKRYKLQQRVLEIKPE